MIIHNDTPRSEWKLTAVEKLMTDSDGIVRAAEIRTAGGRTNRPIAQLIPLEVNHDVTQEEKDSTHTTRDSEDVSLGRPTRQAALTAQNKIKEWTGKIRATPGGCCGLTLFSVVIIFVILIVGLYYVIM